MKPFPIMITALVVVLATAGGVGARSATPEPPREPGARFFGLTSCSDHLLFLSEDSAYPSPDTLALDPSEGSLTWLGGPVRGMARAPSDTVCIATLLGVHLLTADGRDFVRWTVPPGGSIPDDPSGWPKTRRPLPQGLEGPARIGEVVVLPERYFPLADGNLLFLVDAANPPPDRTTLLFDLHARFENDVEWRVARNLEVRDWVLSPDSLSWAVVARVHRPDYGGEVSDMVIAGLGATTQSFPIESPRTLLWDGAGQLWICQNDGHLTRLEPAEGAWRVERVRLAETVAPCPPGDSESVWTWIDPRRFIDESDALRVSKSVTGEPRPTTWVARETDGAYRSCWGGFLTEEALIGALPEPPAEGAIVARVPAGGFLGPVAKLRDPGLAGTATLRSALHHGKPASELWWRFDGSERPVRMAGPWIATELTPTAPSSSIQAP